MRIKKRILIPLIALGLICSAALWAFNTLSSPQWWGKFLVTSLNKSKGDIHVREILIDSVRLDIGKGSIHFKGVKTKFKVKQASYFISTGDLIVDGVYGLLSPSSNIPFQAKHNALVSDQLNVSDMNIQGVVVLAKRQVERYEGEVIAKTLEFNKVFVSDLKSKVSGDLTKVKFSELAVALYQGHLKSEILIGFADVSSLSINANYEGIDVAQLVAINPALFSQMKGLVDGQVQVTAQDGKIKAFRGRGIAPHGGMVKAALIKFLLQYMPQKEQIEMLIAGNDDIPLNQAKIETVSFNDEKFASQIKLFSSQLNMDINLTLDINLEGGLVALLMRTGILTE